MNRSFLLSVTLLLFWGCSPEKAQETLSTEPIAQDTASLDQVADSVTDTPIDGTATTTLPQDVKQQLPAELEVHLDRTHGLWQLPVLSTFDVQRIPKEEQGPYYLQADFNGDKKVDYAVQLLERDSAFVYAFLKKADNEFQEFVLVRDRLYDIEEKKRSIHYLRLAPDTATYYDYATRKKGVRIPHDGISVGAENYTATYFWEKGKFNKLETGD
ncbi:hypothetical protein [Rufibacter latericius]|nr:hypothetical protein [Rufibacter latericius]